MRYISKKRNAHHYKDDFEYHPPEYFLIFVVSIHDITASIIKNVILTNTAIKPIIIITATIPSAISLFSITKVPIHIHLYKYHSCKSADT